MAKTNTSPELRFAGFAEDWEEKDFEKVFTNISNNSLSREKLNYVTGIAKNVHYGDILVKFNDVLDIRKEVLPYISDNATVEKLKNSFLKEGDIIISDAAEDETVGKCVELYNVNNDKILSGLHTIGVRPKENFAPKFLGYYMNSNSYHDQLLELMQGTKVLSISKTAIKKTVIRNPKSKDEQKLIGNFFENLDNLITEHQQKHSKLQSLKQAMLDKMFPKQGQLVPEIRFKGFEGHWEEKKIKDIIDDIVDNRGKNPRYYCNEGIPVIDNYMIRNNCYPNLKEASRFIDEDLFENFIRDYNKEDDTLITLVGNGIGNITLFPNKKSVIIQNTLGLRFSTNKIFMFFYLLSINKKILMLNRGMAQPSIRQDELLSLDIIVPKDVNEQQKIGNYFKNLDELIDNHENQITKLQNIKKAFLAKMFI